MSETFHDSMILLKYVDHNMRRWQLCCSAQVCRLQNKSALCRTLSEQTAELTLFSRLRRGLLFFGFWCGIAWLGKKWGEYEMAIVERLGSNLWPRLSNCQNTPSVTAFLQFSGMQELITSSPEKFGAGS